jgi:tetratricopeptide (TPR) repeat protein
MRWTPQAASGQLNRRTLSPARGAVVAFLVAEPGPHDRKEVCEALDIKLSGLRNVLHGLAKSDLMVGSEVLAVDNGSVELRVDATTSALEFVRNAARTATLPADLEKAYALAKLGFMTALDHPGGWLADVRAELGELAVALCSRALSVADLNLTSALRWIGHWTHEQPYETTPVGRAVEVLAELGEPALALAELEKLVERLQRVKRQLDGPGRELLLRLQTGNRGQRIPLRSQPIRPWVAPVPEQIPVEREAQLVKLQEELAGGRLARKVVLLEGSSGMGKTLLAWRASLAWLAAESEPGGGRLDTTSRGYPALLWARFGAPEYYGAYFGALAEYADQLNDQELEDQFGSRAAVLARHLPTVAERLSVEDAPAVGDTGGQRDRLFAAVAKIVRRIQRAGPVVFVLDDLHKASAADRALLNHLLRATDLTPMTFVITYQRSERLEPWLAGLHQDVHNVMRLEVGPLSGAGVRQLMPGASAETIERVMLETGGQPYRVARWDKSANTDAAVVPALEPEVLDVLAASALVPGGLDVESLQRAFGHEVVDRALTVAFEHQIVLETATTVAFVHDLVRDELLRLAEPRLEDLAAELSHVLEVTGVDSVASAHIAAQAGDSETAARFWRQAAEDANAALAPDDAALHFQRALELSDDPAVRATLLNALGLTLWQAGEFRRATEAFSRAVAIAERERLAIPLAMGALGLAGPLGFQGVTVDFDVVGKLREAIDLLVDDDGLTHQALTRAALAQALTFADAEERREVPRLAAEAEQIARDKLGVGDAEANGAWLLIEVLSRTGWATWDPTDGVARRARANELVGLADTTNSPSVVSVHRLESRIQRIANAVEYGDMKQARQDIEECAKLAEQTRLRYYKALTTAMRGMLALLDGPAAEHPYTWEALEIGQRDQNQAIIQLFGAQLLYIRMLQGRTAELQAASQQLAGYYKAIAGWRAGQALILALDGRMQEAAAHVEDLMRDGFVAVGRDMFYLVCLDHIARTAVLVEDHLPDGALDVIYRALLPFAGRNVVAAAAVAIHGPADVALALLAAHLGDTQIALGHLAAAEPLARSTGCRPALVEIGTLRLLLEGGLDELRADADLAHVDALVEEICTMRLATAAEHLVGAISVLKARAVSTDLPIDLGRLQTAAHRLAPLLEAPHMVPLSRTRRKTGTWLVTNLMPRLGPLVTRLKDTTLEANFKRSHSSVMRAMAALYQPDRGLGFSGEIGFRFLLADDRPIEWHIEVEGRSAAAHPGPSSDPATLVITRVRPFADLLTGNLNGVRGWVEGLLDIEGDPTLAARLVDMFGGAQALESLVS